MDVSAGRRLVLSGWTIEATAVDVSVVVGGLSRRGMDRHGDGQRLRDLSVGRIKVSTLMAETVIANSAAVAVALDGAATRLRHRYSHGPVEMVALRRGHVVIVVQIVLPAGMMGVGADLVLAARHGVLAHVLTTCCAFNQKRNKSITYATSIINCIDLIDSF